VNAFSQMFINLIVGALLGITLHFYRHHLDRKSIVGRLYCTAGMMVIVMLLLEPLTVYLRQVPGTLVQGIMNIAHVFLFISPSGLALCWLLCAEEIASAEKTGEEKMNPLFLVPVGLIGVLAVLSPFHGFLFYLDETGTAQRGPLFLLLIVAIATYILTGLFYLSLRWNCVLKKRMGIFAVIPFLPILGGALQVQNGFPLGWGTAASSLIALYIYRQERLIRTDSLTSAWTKGPFERRLASFLQQNSGEPFGVIYLDIDNLKSINDRYGHVAGDQALKALVDVVKRAIRKSDAIARLGGDEFGILVHVNSQLDLEAVTKKIERILDTHNLISEAPYQISCSMGAKLFQKNAECSVDHIISQVDSLMYANKRRRRSEDMAVCTK